MNNTEIKNDIINFFKIFKDIDTKSNYNLVPDFNNFNDILDYFNFNKIFFFTEDIFFEILVDVDCAIVKMLSSCCVCARLNKLNIFSEAGISTGGY